MQGDQAGAAQVDVQVESAGGRLPSTYEDGYWIGCHHQQDRTPSPDPGKWMIFVPIDQVDAAWELVSAAVREGRLGPSAKVSTAKPNPNARDLSRRVVIVYTADWRDEDDVRRVLCGLRDLGFMGKLSYKADATTLAGRYGSGVASYISDAGSRTFRDGAQRGRPTSGQESLF